jgi:hypothetical protein
VILSTTLSNTNHVDCVQKCGREQTKAVASGKLIC